MAGRVASVEEVLGEALRDKPFYREDGGVTFSGGEPLAQWAFARALADRLREEGVHVALDTACLAAPEVVRHVPEHFALVLADLKLVTPEAHRRWTGVDNEQILATIRLWSEEMAGRIWISLPAIPGVQDEQEMRRVADFVCSLGPPPPVRVLPYHKLGSSKYRALGEEPPQFEDDPRALAEKYEGILRDAGLEVIEQ
jgi:pyruvate formate lyase activating enzyme